VKGEEEMEAIYRRRSIRKYTKEPVPQEALREFIRAGMNAPSAGNQQPWYFVIIDRRDLLDAIADIHPYAQMLRQAQAAILVCGDLDLERHEGFWVQDCSAATENILLEIADQGYGGVWLGVYPRNDRVQGIRRLLEIPERVIPFSLIAVGHPAEEKEPKGDFREERIRHNRWKD
jgi:nitroreductase